MRTAPSIARPRQQAALSLLLALMLALSPLMALAQPLAAADNTAGGPVNGEQMPCHSESGGIDVAAMQAHCPHCAGDAPATQCQCCDQAAPAGLLNLAAGDPVKSTGDSDHPAILSDALPRSPGERLYRPPIQSS